MHTYRVEVHDGAGALVIAVRLRCWDDAHALQRLDALRLPPGKVSLLRGQRQVRRPLAAA